MRSHILGLTLLALLTPHPSRAQSYLHLEPTPAPTVTAAREQWQITGEAIFYKGEFYYPTGPTEFFDPRVMQRTGTHDGVPLYENATLLPFEIVYVPVGGKQMRPYERKRDGWRAGTTGSRLPSFAVQPRFSGPAMAEDREPYSARLASGRAQWDWPRPVEVVTPPALTAVPGRGESVVPQGVIRDVPRRETTNAGAYLVFDGARHYSSGRAVVPNADRFARAGESRGAVVYREVRGDARTVYVEAVPGGPLAPYTRR